MAEEPRTKLGNAKPAHDGGAKKSGLLHFCPFAALGIVDDWNYEFYCEIRSTVISSGMAAISRITLRARFKVFGTARP